LSRSGQSGETPFIKINGDCGVPLGSENMKFSEAIHICGLRRMIWSVLRAIFPPETKNAAHVWHTWPLLMIGFMGGSGNGRLTGVQHLLFPWRHAGWPGIGHTTGTPYAGGFRFYRGSGGVLLIGDLVAATSIQARRESGARSRLERSRKISANQRDLRCPRKFLANLWAFAALRIHIATA
jgi:hypothetical protein